MKLKIPNILTIGRIIIVPIFVLTFFIPGFFGDLIPFFLCHFIPNSCVATLLIKSRDLKALFSIA